MKNLITRIALFVLKFFGVTLNDLVAYRKNQSVAQSSPEQLKQLPLEILYDGGYRSFFFEADKIPVAIIVGYIGLAFDNAPAVMHWYDAKKYCKRYSIGGKEWSLPNHKAGHLGLIYNNKAVINTVLTAFGKEPLKETCYWSSSEYNGNGARNIYLKNGNVYTHLKSTTYNCARPVTVL